LNLARKKAGLQDLILITGSLFVAGEARKLIKERLICTTH
jgi:folylpolyglutamate synthase/dihydropteroate synthase